MNGMLHFPWPVFAIGLVTVFAPVRICGQPASFYAPIDWLMQPVASIATADFDRDGRADVAMANPGQNRVMVLLDRKSLTSFAVGTMPVSVVAADFNHDGNPDLAVADSGSHDVSVLLGKGNGDFRPAQMFSTSSAPFYIVAGDFDGDGNTDVLVTHRQSLSLLLGRGDGTLFPPVTISLPYDACQLAAADFNGDGKLDVASIKCYEGGIWPNELAVLLGHGDGTFDSPVTYPAGKALARAIVAVDLNGDGTPDLAVANGDYDGADGFPYGSVAVLLARSDGSFGPVKEYGYDAFWGLAAGDVNLDGKIDLVTSSTVFEGAGDGTFPTTKALAVPGDLLALADFNADGKLDVASAGVGFVSGEMTGVDILSIRIGQGDGTFQMGNTITLPGQGACCAAAGDFNSDGVQDLAIVLSGVGIVVAFGHAGVSQPPGLVDPSQPSYLAVADFNGDGRMDLAATFRDGDVRVFLGRGDGTFQMPVVTPAVATDLRGAVVGDFDGDGKADLAITGNNPPAVLALLGHGDGTFELPARSSTLPIPYDPGPMIVSDYNLDGKPDLALAPCQGCEGVQTIVLLGIGDGTFQSPLRVPLENKRGGYGSLGSADFDGDGNPDLAVGCRSPVTSKPDFVAVLRGKGDGTFEQPTIYLVGRSFITIADFNGDGHPDLAAAGGGTLRSCSARAMVPSLPRFGHSRLGETPFPATSMAITRLTWSPSPILI